MKKGTSGKNANTERIKKTLRQFISPTFILILFGSCLLWYILKLGATYTTEIPLNVRIDGQKYRMTTVVTGRGSSIVARRLLLKSVVDISLDELSTRRSRETEGGLTITPASLQRAVNAQMSDLKVDQVVSAPDFVPAPEGETPKERRQREREEAKAKREAEKAAKAEAKAAEEAAAAEAEK